MVINAGFTMPTAAQCSLIIWRSPRISAITLSFVSVVAAVAARPVTYVIFSVLKTTDPESNWTNTYGILLIHAFQASMNLYRTSAFRSKKFSQHSLHSAYDHNPRHFTLLLRWTHVTYWSTDDPDSGGQWNYLVDKTRNCTWRYIQKIKTGGITFVITLAYVQNSYLNTKCIY